MTQVDQLAGVDEDEEEREEWRKAEGRREEGRGMVRLVTGWFGEGKSQGWREEENRGGRKIEAEGKRGRWVGMRRRERRQA